MNTCPFCKSEVSEYCNAFKCLTWIEIGGSDIRKYQSKKCMLSELKSAKARIKALVKAGDSIIENGSVSERLFNEWNKAKGGA